MASTSPRQRATDIYTDSDSDIDLDDHDVDLRARVIQPDLLRDTDDDVGAQFDLNWRGYDRHQVDAYLRSWGDDFWATRNERDALLAEVEQLRAQPPQQLSPLSSMSVRLQDIVRAAEEEAEALRYESREAADELLARAREQADADRSAAAAERTVAAGEADRITREAREQHDRLVGDAHDEAQRARSQAHSEATRSVEDAQAEASRLVGEATTEAAEIRRIVAAEEEQTLAAARAEADELARSTARARDIAEAEHQRLLAAHTSQQRHLGEGLRLEVAELKAEIERLTGEVERRRTQLIAVAPETPISVVAPRAMRAAEDTGETISLESMMHGDTGEVFVAEETSIFERAPRPAPRTTGIAAGEGEAAADGTGDAIGDDALELVADDESGTGETRSR